MKTCPKCHQVLPDDALFCPMDGISLASVEGDPLLGSVIADRYVLMEHVGQGNSGTIYRAEHIVLKQKIAIKLLHHKLSQDESAVDRFRQEAATLAQINNSHIVRVTDFGVAEDERIFFAMEYLEGETLAQTLNREGKLEQDRALNILKQIGDALAEAHKLGFVHRDIRPRNIFLCETKDKKDNVKLLDFGLAKLVDIPKGAKTALGTTLGDPCYMSPEQARGDMVDTRSDLYSLAIIGYEMITGKPPFVGSGTFDVITKHLKTQPTPIAEKVTEISAHFASAIDQALSKKPSDRYNDVNRFLDALEGKAPVEILLSEKAAALKISSSKKQKEEVSIETPKTKPNSATSLTPTPEKTKTKSAELIVSKAASAKAKAPLKDSITAEVETAKKAEEAKAETPKKATEPEISPLPEKPAKAKTSEKPVKAGIKKEKPEAEKPEAEKPEAEKPEVDRAQPTTEKTETEQLDPAATAPYSAKTNKEQIVLKNKTLLGTGVKAKQVMKAIQEGEETSASKKRRKKKSRKQKKVAAKKVEPTKTEPTIDKPKVLPSVEIAKQVVQQTTATSGTVETTEPKQPTPQLQQEAPVITKTAQTANFDEYDYTSQSGNWFAEGLAAEQELATKTKSGPLPKIYDAMDEEEGIKRKIDASAIIGVVVAAFAIFLLLFLVVFKKEGKDEKTIKHAKVTQNKAIPPKELKPELKEKTKPELKEKTKPELKPELKEKTKPEPKVTPKIVLKASPKLESKPKPRAKPKPKLKTTPRIGSRKRPSLELKPKPRPKPKKVALGRDPLGAATHVREGQMQLRKGGYSKARDEFNKALGLDKRNAGAYAGLGEVAFELGRYGLAIRHLRTAVLLNQGNSRYKVLLGNSYFKKGRTKKAVEQYRAALKKNPGNQAARTGLEAAVRRLASGG